MPVFQTAKRARLFSLDEKRQFLDNNCKLRLYDPPEIINFDLRVGYKDFIRRDEEKKDRLDDLLTWINKHREKFLVEGERDSDRLYTDFCDMARSCDKTSLHSVRYKESWQMALSRHKGTIYLSEVETWQARERRLNQSARQDEMCYWGYKFEDYVTCPIEKNQLKNIDEPINNKEAFCSVMRCRLDRHSIVFGAEVDCCLKAPSNPPLNYIELKTSRLIENNKMQWSFERYKLLKWWGQSFLAGVPRIICGFRDDYGVVKKLQSFKTLEIPHLVSQSYDMWTGNVCLNFTNEMLGWMKSFVVDENVIYMLHWREPFTHVELEISRNERDEFLPDWYITK